MHGFTKTINLSPLLAALCKIKSLMIISGLENISFLDAHVGVEVGKIVFLISTLTWGKSLNLKYQRLKLKIQFVELING